MAVPLPQLAKKQPYNLSPNRVIFRRDRLGHRNRMAATTESGASDERAMRARLDMMQASAARLTVLRENSDIIAGYRQISTFDGHTCLICMAYSGACWDLKGNPIRGTVLPFLGGPPRHFNCRSGLVAILKNRLFDNAATTRASDEGPLPASMTFDDFLRRKSQAYQDKMLGAGRGDLWRRGKIVCRDLLDREGHILTLEELQAQFDH